MSLPYCPRFVYADGSTTLDLAWPASPWNRSVLAIGGDIEASSLQRAAYIVRRDELLTMTLRFHEDEYADVQAWLSFVSSTGELFSYYPDRARDDVFTVYLHAPAKGGHYDCTPDSAYPKLLNLSITLCAASWAGLPVWEPRVPIPDDETDNGGSDDIDGPGFDFYLLEGDSPEGFDFLLTLE